MEPTRFHLSQHTKQLVNYLLTVKIDEEVPYEQLSTLIGCDILDPKHRANLTSARCILIKDHNIVFGTIIKFGLKRLKDEEIVLEGDKSIRRIRRECRRGARKVVCIQNYSALPQEAQIKHNQSLSILGTLRYMTSNKQLNKIAEEVKICQVQLDHTKLLEVCSK